MSEERINRKQKNIGISILKCFLCYLVICCHFWKNDHAQGVYHILEYGKNIAVPCYIIISLYYTGGVLDGGKRQLVTRLMRLWIPLIFWTPLYVLGEGISNVLVNGNFGIQVNDVLWQIVLGSEYKINSSMWFIGNLIIIYLVLYFLRQAVHIISVFLGIEQSKDKELYICIIVLLSFFFYIIQYSGILKLMIVRIQVDELKQSLLRLFETFPIATAGYVLYDTRALDKRINSKYFALISILYIILVSWYECYASVSGFGYGGIDRIISSVILVLLFARVRNINYLVRHDNILRVVNGFTEYTFGIYCLHMIVGQYMIRFLKILTGKELYTLVTCLIIYLLCYMICFTLEHINPFFKRMIK